LNQLITGGSAMKSFLYRLIFYILLLFTISSLFSQTIEQESDIVSTFSICGYDPETGELGVAVASRFFAVGNVVPWAKAGVGAVATQSFANTSFGWRGLEVLEKGNSPEKAMKMLLENDTNPKRRQVGIVAHDGSSATYTGEECLSWAGGRSGKNYACQGNILAGEAVVIEMEKSFLNSKGSLAERLYAALIAGEAAGGDARGKQSAALLVVKEKGGYGGYTDRYIDIRVDDHPEPFEELGRILNIAMMNGYWNQGWTAYKEKRYKEALEWQEKTAKLAPYNAEVFYDLAIIRAWAGEKDKALVALENALILNPGLKKGAPNDQDLKPLHKMPGFKEIVK
jgi:uncharacterized Ntn-hydrolase superfamily protein